MLVHSTGIQPPVALFYGTFVKAAYDVYAADPTNLNPSQSEYPSFPVGYQLFANLQMSDFFRGSTTPKYYGFIATRITSPSTFVVALRGTQTWEEWWDDFHWGLVPFPYLPNGGYVADGFLTIYNTLSAMVPDSSQAPALVRNTGPLPTTGTAGPITALTVAGHSLGAALVTLYAADLVGRSGLNPVVYTLASPRVGDRTFAAAYNARVGTSYRVYNWPDLVPDFPKDPVDNYQHVKGGYEVDSLDYPSVVKISVDCFHALGTYLYLLGAPAGILGSCGE